MAEACVAPQYRCAAELHFPRFQHDRLVQGQVAGFVVFAEEDAEQGRVALNLHHHTHLMALMLDASTCPTQTAIRQHATESTILPPARNHSPSLTRFKVCR